MLAKNITEYHLLYKEGLSANTIHRIKHGKDISTKTLDALCFVLNCEVSDIIEHLKQ
ncbi:MAG: helix-turn-helix transcriptional regulator [Oscillospiraceae bacterium]|nr:helix-turn-helix transcriptional regulator [Oscillospiraceae bacterium]